VDPLQWGDMSLSERIKDSSIIIDVCYKRNSLLQQCLMFIHCSNFCPFCKAKMGMFVMCNPRNKVRTRICHLCLSIVMGEWERMSMECGIMETGVTVLYQWRGRGEGSFDTHECVIYDLPLAMNRCHCGSKLESIILPNRCDWRFDRRASHCWSLKRDESRINHCEPCRIDACDRIGHESCIFISLIVIGERTNNHVWISSMFSSEGSACSKNMCFVSTVFSFDCLHTSFFSCKDSVINHTDRTTVSGFCICFRGIWWRSCKDMHRKTFVGE